MTGSLTQGRSVCSRLCYGADIRLPDLREELAWTGAHSVVLRLKAVSVRLLVFRQFMDSPRYGRQTWTQFRTQTLRNYPEHGDTRRACKRLPFGEMPDM